jgi:hypothetical protein
MGLRLLEGLGLGVVGLERVNDGLEVWRIRD